MDYRAPDGMLRVVVTSTELDSPGDKTPLERVVGDFWDPQCAVACARKHTSGQQLTQADIYNEHSEKVNWKDLL
jgi:hypothetical protein